MNRPIFVLLFLLLSALPRDATAQEGMTVRVVPRFGLLSPDGSLYEEFKNFAGDGYIEWTSGSLGRAALVGVGAEAAFQELGVRVRGEVSRSFGGWLAATHGVLIPRVYFEAPQIVNTFFDVPASITLASLQAILPTRISYRGVEPFVLLGFSGKWYGFGSPEPENTVEAILPTGGFVPSADLGGGVTFGLFGLTFETQVRDNINRYWGRTQHDLTYSGGLLWAVR